MSQQLLQQDLSYQFHPGAVQPEVASQPKNASSTLGGMSSWQQVSSRTRLHISPKLLVRTVALTAFLLALVMLAYIAASALAAEADYQRQQTQRSATQLREQNAQLRCQLSQAADLARVSNFALAAGMRPADPATESDFLSVTPTIAKAEAKSPVWFSKGPMIAVIIASQFNASYTSGRAEASTPQSSPKQQSAVH